ncbi:MAG: phosphoadenosine phosphosulfate reductase family protein [Robiginitalea sp.]|uniref:phosphoadenosine phosphosulfate reductase domain-containing protein n=1 Tax=Robiginitalea sp. TaxID=1902411 RepID=UPI003C70A080
MKISKRQLNELNSRFKDRHPEDVVLWTTQLERKAVVTTNFRPYEAAILHLVSQVRPEIPVLWCDTGYNTEHTYRHANEVHKLLNLNLYQYAPRQTVAWREVEMGIPGIDHPQHILFTEQVKLEPFRRAMAEHNPEIWFTNLRKGQTAHRDGLGIFSRSKDGILKVSPFFHWSDQDLDSYLSGYGLPNEARYWDPTKVLENRECGLHS